MCSEKSDSLEEALALVDIEYDAKREAEYDAKHEEDVPQIQGWEPFGALIPLNKNEAGQLKTMRGMVDRYIRHQRHAHPLCLAVFGPPGSGKTFAVKQIQKELEKDPKKDPKVKLSRTTINRTQVSSPAELTGALVTALISAAQEEDSVPVIFFDEFDTTRDRAAYGWLSSFLAPMHDGEFLHNGKNVKLQKAVYVSPGYCVDVERIH